MHNERAVRWPLFYWEIHNEKTVRWPLFQSRNAQRENCEATFIWMRNTHQEIYEAFIIQMRTTWTTFSAAYHDFNFVFFPPGALHRKLVFLRSLAVTRRTRRISLAIFWTRTLSTRYINFAKPEAPKINRKNMNYQNWTTSIMWEKTCCQVWE